MEESAPGQFNFINSQLRMNENHVENQNEFKKMSLMVENLVSCKIENIFKDIDHAKEDLKTRIKLAIEASENTSTSTATLAAINQQANNDDALNKKSLISPVTSSDELNNANAEILKLKEQINKLNGASGVAIGRNNGTNSGTNSGPQSNNSKNKFTDFVIGHYTP